MSRLRRRPGSVWSRVGLLLLSGLLGLLPLGACGPRQDASIEETLQGFTADLRWGRFPHAALRVAPEKREAWLARRSAAGAVQLTEVSLEGLRPEPPNPGEKHPRAVAFVGVAWYRLPDMTLQKRLWKQTWQHFEAAGWLLVDEAPFEGPEEPPVAPPAGPSWP